MIEKLVSPIYTQEQLDSVQKLAETGNITAQLNLVLHNQGVLYRKMKEVAIAAKEK